jgi:hypothetical protein
MKAYPRLGAFRVTLGAAFAVLVALFRAVVEV